MNEGTCHEGWNRYICDCSQTSFTGPTCGKGSAHVFFHGGRISNNQFLLLIICTAAASVRFDGTQHLTLRLGMVFSEAENLSFRFKTKRKDTFLIATRTDDAADRLEIYLGNDGSAFISTGSFGFYIRLFSP